MSALPPTTREEDSMSDDAVLSIGDLSERTGVAVATLRMWENRHGFPRAQRLASGHRRYTPADVQAVLDVMARRDAGSRLEAAIADVADLARPAAPSIFARLRQTHPHLTPLRLRKSTLLALSWAIEDEFCAKADHARIFGSFQRERYFNAAGERWTELARVAQVAMVFADFPDTPVPSALPAPTSLAPVKIPLPESAPLRREWAVVCDSRELPVALSAWELPGQGSVRDKDRVFESVWTFEPTAVREAARACASVASSVDAAAAAPVLHSLAGDAQSGVTDLRAASEMVGRIVSYVDAFGR